MDVVSATLSRRYNYTAFYSSLKHKKKDILVKVYISKTGAGSGICHLTLMYLRRSLARTSPAVALIPGKLLGPCFEREPRAEESLRKERKDKVATNCKYKKSMVRGRPLGERFNRVMLST